MLLGLQFSDVEGSAIQSCRGCSPARAEVPYKGSNLVGISKEQRRSWWGGPGSLSEQQEVRLVLSSGARPASHRKVFFHDCEHGGEPADML